MQSVKEAFEVYLERSDVRPNSVRAKRRALMLFVEAFGDPPVTAVTPAMAEDFKVILAKGGRSKSGANTYLNVFKPMFRRLRDHGVIESNPFSYVRPYKVDRKEPIPFTLADLELMAERFPLLWRIRLALGLNSCRRGETANVLVREIHLGRDAHIALSYKEASGQTWPWGVKSYEVRYIGLPEVMAVGGATLHVHRDIVSRMESLPADQPYLCVEEKYYRRMMQRQAAGELTDNDRNDPVGNFNRRFKDQQKLAGVSEPKRYQELRAAFGTAYLSKYDLKSAADAMGHKATSSTVRYDRRGRMSVVNQASELMADVYRDYQP